MRTLVVFALLAGTVARAERLGVDAITDLAFGATTPVGNAKWVAQNRAAVLVSVRAGVELRPLRWFGVAAELEYATADWYTRFRPQDPFGSPGQRYHLLGGLRFVAHPVEEVCAFARLAGGKTYDFGYSDSFEAGLGFEVRPRPARWLAVGVDVDLLVARPGDALEPTRTNAHFLLFAGARIPLRRR